MTLRARLLSHTLAMVAAVAVTLAALNLNSLAENFLDMALASSEMTASQIKQVVRRRLAHTPVAPTLAETKRLWNRSVEEDRDLAAMLEGTMAESSSIGEINVAGEDFVILATSNPSRRGKPMIARQDLKDLRGASPLGRVAAILEIRHDYETRVALAIEGQTAPVITIQVLVLPSLLRAAIVPPLQKMAIISITAMVLAFALAFWSSQVALRPLARINLLIDDIVGGRIPEAPRQDGDDARELALIESKLSLLGERFRETREDASQLRLNLEGALEKLDAGTRTHIENQLAVARRLTAINSLTSQVAHEIKNPLNSISLRLELLRSRVGEDAPDTDAEFSILSEEVTRLDRVVRTFLDFNRPVELEPEQLDLVEAARDALQFLEPEALDRGIRVVFTAPDAPALVQADPGLLRQALVNIAVNAIEAMGAGGELRMALQKSSETCTIRIEDTGPGIPPEQLAKVFQLYFTTKPRGTGIGLAMAYRAIQLHGGTIEVESEPGKGTAFLVILPLAGLDRTR